MVTGGHSGTAGRDSTEIFNENTWRTVAGKLPLGAISNLRLATINNRVLTFGN